MKLFCGPGKTTESLLPLSALAERLTPPIFTHWLRNAQRKYPYLKDLSDDQGQLRLDVTEAFDYALAAAAEEPAEKPPGYFYYFICGFIKGYLNARWYFKYMVRARVMDSTFCTILAMWEFLKQRPDLEEPLGALFRKCMDDFQAHDHPAEKEPPDTAPTQYLDRALKFLHKALVHHFRPMRESKCEKFCPDVDRFLKPGDIKPFLRRHPGVTGAGQE